MPVKRSTSARGHAACIGDGLSDDLLGGQDARVKEADGQADLRRWRQLLAAWMIFMGQKVLAASCWQIKLLQFRQDAGSTLISQRRVSEEAHFFSNSAAQLQHMSSLVGPPRELAGNARRNAGQVRTAAASGEIVRDARRRSLGAGHAKFTERS